MELQTLLAFFIAAAISLVAAAFLTALRPRALSGRPRANWWRDGALIGPISLGLGFVLTAPFIRGDWPQWPPSQAVDRTIWLVACSAAASIVLGLRFIPSLLAWLLAAAAGAWAITAYPLGRILSEGSSTPAPGTWRIGIIAAVTLLSLIAASALACAHRASRQPPPTPPPTTTSRLATRLWAVAGFTIILAFAGPAGLFSYSVQFGQLLAVLFGAWCGLALCALITRVSLAPAAVTALTALAAIWLCTYFFSVPPEETPEAITIKRASFALLALAPLGLAIGLLPFWKRRPRARFAAVLTACGLLAAAAFAIQAPSYLRNAAESAADPYANP